MAAEVLDYRSTDGITVGLIQSIITAAQALRDRSLRGEPVRHALAILAEDEHVAWLMWAAEDQTPLLGSQLAKVRADLRHQEDVVAEKGDAACES
jgi:hypothetical protein